jgi:hypothetical protein
VLRDRIGGEMMASVNSRNRHPTGLIGFEESQYMAAVVARRLRPQDDLPAAELPGLTRDLRARLKRGGDGLRRSHLLSMSPQEQQARFGLKDEDLPVLRRAAIGLVPSEEDPAMVWDRRRFGGTMVPDLVNLDLDEARRRLAAVGLKVTQTSSVDSPACKGKVLKQSPQAGPVRLGTDGVQLELSSGACVLVPEVAGLTLAEAIHRLRNAGAERPPKLTPQAGRMDSKVKNVRPRPGSWITPGAEINLILG